MSRRLLLLSTFAFAACTVQRAAPPTVAASADDHAAHMRPEDLTLSVMSHGPSASMDEMQQGDLTIPASAATAPARLAASPRHSEWVKFPSAPGASDSIMAWVVYPKASGKAPVVVVVHEIFGLQTWVRAVADQVAADGFIAIAPDFLSRVRGGPSSVELHADTARGLIGGVNTAERNKVIAAAANYAMMLPAAQQKYAVIGYCWGGTTTFAHGVNGGLKGFAGGVAFYGSPYMTGGTPATATTAAVPARPDADSLKKIDKPIMLLNGSLDARIAAAMPAIDSIMKANKKNYTGVNYEGAIHGFLRAQNDPRAPRAARGAAAAETQEIVDKELAANLAASKAAWPATIAFLKKNLGVK
jgi:carboxymethylenebutenolidase